MTFKDLPLKESYNSDYDNILEEFYVPTLSNCSVYKRIAGYFSSSSFGLAARGISRLVANDGHMQFVVNVQLSQADFDQIQAGTASPEKIIEDFLLEGLDELQSNLEKQHSKVLGWLIAHGYVEIKVGYIGDQVTGHDILHQKVGIMTDVEGNSISFSGSNNESAHGWKYHAEKFKVFRSWDTVESKYLVSDEKDFSSLWNDEGKRIKVVDFPKAVRERLISIAPENKDEFYDLLNSIEAQEDHDTINTGASEKMIELRPYQNEAVKSWIDNEYRGLFEMATGTGKTFTAVACVDELCKKESSLLIVVSCPFLHLLPQWEKSFSDFGLDIEIEYASSHNANWKKSVWDKILDIKIGRKKKLVVFTTHTTSSNSEFLQLIDEAKIPTLFVADEVHGMGAVNRIEGLTENYNYRIGLTATPNRYFDDEGTEKLKKFFEKTVIEFTLEMAINTLNPSTGKSFLTPYNYHPIKISLSDDELESYIELTKTIGRMYAMEKRTKSQEEILQRKLLERSDVLKNAIDKIPAFRELLTQLMAKKECDHTLVYCSPQQIGGMQAVVRENPQLNQHRFTSSENATRREKRYGNLTEREYILKNFDEGHYDILIAIKCLDEGVDVPSTKNAILLCSTGNPKEWIQRRGRVLRRTETKEIADIYDFVVIPDLIEEVEDWSTRIAEQELRRVVEFGSCSKNKNDVDRWLYDIKLKYKIVNIGDKNG